MVEGVLFGSECSAFDSPGQTAKSHLSPRNTRGIRPDNTRPFPPSIQPLEPQQSELWLLTHKMSVF